MERREEGPTAPVTMNAFELISTSQGLNLSSLFEKQMVRLDVVFSGCEPYCSECMKLLMHIYIF